MKDYVRDYFDRFAGGWVEAAYVGDTRFPLGPERVRLAIEGVAPAVGEGGALIDLGCGGGQLLVHAARLGWTAVGVDPAPGMIAEARQTIDGLPVRLIQAGFDETGLEAGSFDAVTAMGLIEYLPRDDELLAEAARLLKSGGRFAVSCRNRLYNLHSANAYTQHELESGEAAALLEELRAELTGTEQTEVQELAHALARIAENLRSAAEADRDVPAPQLHDHRTSFAQERRQHTPAELEPAAERAGLERVAIHPLHPHPLPPALEPLSPRAYNTLALAWQRALEGSPLGLAFSSAFVAVFEKP